MTRKTKTTIKEKPSKEESSPSEKVLLSEEEVYDVLKMAQSIYSGVSGQGFYPSVWTPDLVNQRFRDITLTPQVATLAKINEALSAPKENEEALIGYSQWLELNSILYRRVLLYYSGLLSFDWNYVATNVKDSKEFKSPSYKRDLLVVQEFFDKFNVKESFATVLKEMLRNETYYGVLRDEGERFTIQELPRQYCKLVGRFDYGLLFSFNMNWFLQGGLNLDMYPEIFKKFYRQAFMDSSTKGYNPALPVGSRDSNWVYWVDCDPEKNFVAFKLFPEIGTNISFLSAYMPDAILQPLVRSLQLDSYIADASKLLAGAVPYLKDAKASVKDQIALSPETLGKFLALMKSALPQAIKVVSVPLEDIQGVEFTGNEKMYDSYLSTAAASSGVNSRLIYAKDRQNLLETKLSMDIDINILRPVYWMFENMLQFWVNQRTSKYKFKFIFEGFNTTIDRDERRTSVLQLAENGLVLEQKFASAWGMSPFDLRRMMEESKASDFVGRLTPIVKASQKPASTNENGRHPKKESELSDSGGQSRADGSNEESSEE